MKFKALSLWQPHAAAIRMGLKPFETRSWATSYRGPLVIHAAKRPLRCMDYEAEWYQEACSRISRAGTPHYALRYGELECIATVADCIRTDHLPRSSFGMASSEAMFWGDFSPGRFAFRLVNIHPLPYGMKATGRQGFFEVDLPPSVIGPYGIGEGARGLFE